MAVNQPYDGNARKDGMRPNGKRQVPVRSAARTSGPEPSFRFLLWSFVLFAVFLGSIVAFDYSNGHARLSMSSNSSLTHFAGGSNRD
jgi:hypothetical protein